MQAKPISSLQRILRSLHHRIEARECARITQSDMAARLGISQRTYLEYLRGTHAPIGMGVVFDLLCMLDEASLQQTLQDWQRTKSLTIDITKDRKVKDGKA